MEDQPPVPRVGSLPGVRVIDRLTNETRAIVDRVRRLQVEGYDDQDLGVVARDCAAVWERSLKASDPTWAAARASLHRMTEDLRVRGWGAASALHEVREAANTDKHDPAPSHELSELLVAAEELATACEGLEHLLPGSLAEIPERARRRRMVCAVYDYFHAGEVEYSFLAASPDDTWQTVVEVDGFQVESRHSRQVEALLSGFTGWTPNPPEFARFADSLRESDNELWMVASFTASYEDVLGVLLEFQHDMPLMRGLHREDHAPHLVATAVQDFIGERNVPGTTERNRVGALRIQARVTHLLQEVPEAVGRLRLDRCDERAFQVALVDAISSDSELGIAVRPNGLVLVRN